MAKRQKTRRRPKRQGIVLLVVLSLLVIFILMAVTYIIISGQYLSRAKQVARHGLTGDDPRLELERVFYQLLRGPGAGSRSSLLGHSLWEDLYGNDSIFRTVNTITPTTSTGTNSQFIQINLQVTVPNHLPGDVNGRVLTMLSGQAAMLSTRIVASDLSGISPLGNGWEPGIGGIRVEAFEGDGTGPILIAGGDEFLINGRPFNGTGAGYDKTTFNLDNNLGGVDVALMPHYSRYIDLLPPQQTTELRWC